MEQQRAFAKAEFTAIKPASSRGQRPRAKPSAGSLHQKSLEFLRNPPPPGHALDNYDGEPEAAQVISRHRSKARPSASALVAPLL